MWKGWYGKEPFDLRLTALRMLHQLPLILVVTFLGTLVFGGGYYMKNVLFAGRPSYAASSVYRVEYAVEEEKDVGTVHINEMSWNTYVHSDFFLDAVRMHLSAWMQEGRYSEEMAYAAAECVEMGDQLGGMLEAFLGSDLRVPSTTVTSDDPVKCVLVALAAEAAMEGELAGEIREIVSISVIDSGNEGYEVVPDVRPMRAFVLSGALSCFFVVVALLLKETGDDSIWLPGSLWRRYGLKTAGTVESRELAENIKYFFGEKPDRAGISVEEALVRRPSAGRDASAGRRIAVCGVQEQVNAEAVLEKLRKACAGTVDISKEEPGQAGGTVWFPLPSPLQCPEVCEKLRRADGILLAVRAGGHAGRQLERTLELLAQQDCHVTAAVLWEADERLIRRYYFCAGKLDGRMSKA